MQVCTALLMLEKTSLRNMTCSTNKQLLLDLTEVLSSEKFYVRTFTYFLPFSEAWEIYELMSVVKG